MDKDRPPAGIETTPAGGAAEMSQERAALLFMLEDLERSRHQVERAHQEWMAALDVVSDPIFLHDKEFRILRCNRAYQRCAGIPFKQIIGQPYYEIFPKSGSPLPSCLRAMEKAEVDEEEVVVGEAIYRSRAFSIMDEQGAYLYSMHTLEDITESKRAAEVLSESETRFRNLVETTSDWIWEVDENIVYTYASPKIHDILGYQAAEIVGKTPYDLMPPEEAKRVAGIAGTIMATRKPFTNLENINLHKDGHPAVIETSGVPVIDLHGKFCGYRGINRDITERKRADEELQLTYFALNHAVDSVFFMEPSGKFRYVNETACRVLGYSREELLSMGVADIDPNLPECVPLEMSQATKKAGLGRVESVHRAKDGHLIPVEIMVAYLQYKGEELHCSFVRDITERKRSEQELMKFQQRAQHYLDIVGVLLISLDAQGRVQMVNRKGCEMLGHSETDILGNDWFDNYLPESARKEVKKVFTQMMNGNVAPVEYFENDILTGSGDVLTVAWHNSLLLDEAGKINGVLSSGEDITARKQAEVAIQHANRALATLSTVNRSLVHATDEDELLQAICQAIVEQRGYRMAWVGYVQHDESKSIKIMAYASNDGGHPDTMQPTWAESEHGMGPSGHAIRSGATQLCQDIANDPHYSPWRDEALKRGYAASIALPLLHGDNTVFGTLTVYAEEVNAFSPSEISLLEEMAGDMAFGVYTLHTRHERDLALVKNQEQLVQLQDSLEDTVRAMAAIVEMRDPYTAGHQVRVAGLASAIATQMGLPDEQVHAIHLAGVVHDLGKIRIPAEILSKPGKITDLEYSFIKTHAQAGYDILQGINFPWPIAQMVLQHHERLDGSGYPQGLKGDAILLEARILCVADVVEAMSSHRPYRPGLGEEAALAEITRQRGIHFDPAVVDACLALFREQHYAFKG